MSNSQKTSPEHRPLNPDEIGFVIKFMREYRQWTQEVLAELCRIDVRTIQRVERGERVSEASLRAIARALELTDIDYFNRPQPIPTEAELEQMVKEFEDKHLLLDATVAESGRALGAAFLQCSMDVSNPAIELSKEVELEFAGLVDYLRDLRDLAPEIGEVEKLTYFEEIDAILKRLRAAGVDVCFATRNANLVGEHWPNKTPWRTTLMYCTAVARGTAPSKLAVPGKIEF